MQIFSPENTVLDQKLIMDILFQFLLYPAEHFICQHVLQDGRKGGGRGGGGGGWGMGPLLLEVFLTFRLFIKNSLKLF